MTKPSAQVYIFTLDPSSESAKTLANKFPSPYFHVNFAEIQNPDGSTAWSPERIEAYRFKKVLEASADGGSTNSILVVKDNATTTSRGSDIQDVVSKAAARPNLSYANLASFNNDCEKMANPQPLNNGARMYDVPSTNGNAALLFSPATRDILIGKTLGPNGKPIVSDLRSINNTLAGLIRQGILTKPIIVQPNVFNYDITKNGKTVVANYCSGTGEGGSAGWGIGLLFLFLLFLLFIFLILKKR